MPALICPLMPEGKSGFFSVRKLTEQKVYGISYYHDEQYGYTTVSLYDISGEWIYLGDSGDGTVSYNDSSVGMEFSVLLDELELVDHYSVNCQTFYSETGEWLDNGENEDNNSATVIIFSLKQKASLDSLLELRRRGGFSPGGHCFGRPAFFCSVTALL